MRARILFFFIGLLLFFSGCTSRSVEKGAFYTAGVWDIPPAYHGNPWAPGGVGVAASFVYEPLFIYIPTTGEYISRLGKSYEESADHLTLTVKLKEGVLWHDGNEFSSADVKTTFYIGYLGGLEIWRNLDEIDCPDPNTVVFKWRDISPTNNIRALTENINSPYHIFGKWADMIPEIRKQAVGISETDVEAISKQGKVEMQVREVLYKYHPEKPIGTGPFQIGKVTASDMLLLKFPQYYEAENVKFDKIRIMRWGSNEVVWSYLIAGEMDAVAPACPYDVVQEIIKRNPGTKLINPSDLSDYGLIFNCQRKPTGDLKFRQAIAHILDRDMVRQVAYTYGLTVEDYSLGIPKSIRDKWLDEDFYRDLTRYDHNFDKAEKLLTELGYRRSGGSDPQKSHWLTPEGKEISLEIIAPSGLSDLILLAEASSAQLTRFGIKTQVRIVPLDIYTRKLQERNFDMAAENGSQMTKYGHPSISYNRFFYKGGIVQSASGIPSLLKYRGQEVDTFQLVKELNRIVDPERTKEIVQELAWITNENLPYLTCYEKRLTIFILDGKRVSGWPSPDAEIWKAAPGGIESLYATLIAKGIIRPADVGTPKYER